MGLHPQRRHCTNACATDGRTSRDALGKSATPDGVSSVSTQHKQDQATGIAGTKRGREASDCVCLHHQAWMQRYSPADVAAKDVNK